MSKANPRKALAALLPLPLECGEDLVVRPMTLGLYAALERISSPLVTGKDAKDTLELIPSLYLLTHDCREVLRGDLLDRSLAWADTLPKTALETIRLAAYRQLNAVFDVIPEPSGSAPQKKTTDGSPSSPNGPRRNTAGTTKPSSGRLRSRLSASSAAPRA